MNKVIKHLVLTLSLLAMMILPVSAYVEIVEQDDSYFVTDEAKVLDSSTEEYIVSKNQILNETSGAAIVVVTVDLLNADISDYAYSIFNEWQLGDETVNNGILLLVSIGDQDYYCMIGRGLESSLSASELQNILDEKLEPDFAAGNYQQGIRKVFDELYQRCVQLYNVDENATSSNESVHQVFTSMSRVFTIIQIVMMLFVVITVLVVLFSITSRQRTTYYRPVRPVPPPPPGPSMHRGPVFTHRPSYPSSRRPASRPVSHSTSRSSGFGSTSHRSSTPRSSSSFRPRSGGSTRGAGAGRRR